jgi:hypothetical protein
MRAIVAHVFLLRSHFAHIFCYYFPARGSVYLIPIRTVTALFGGAFITVWLATPDQALHVAYRVAISFLCRFCTVLASAAAVFALAAPFYQTGLPPGAMLAVILLLYASITSKGLNSLL